MKRIVLLLVATIFACSIYAQKSYSLEDCRQMAASNNKSLLAARESLHAAKERSKAARTQYLPNISATGAYLWNEKNLSLLGSDQFLPVGSQMPDGSFGFTQDQISNNWAIINNSPVPLDANGQPFDPKKNPEKIQWKNYAFIPKDAFEIDMRNVFAGSILLTQPIFMGGKIRQLNKMASYTQKLAEAKLEGETANLTVETDIAYWRVVSLVNKEKLAQSFVALLQKMDSDVAKSIAIGVATKADELSVKVKLNEAEMSLLQVQNGLALSRMALAQLCGLPLDEIFQLEDENLQVEPDASLIVRDSTQHYPERYELKALMQTVNLADANRKLMISRFMPTVGLTAGYFISNPNMFHGPSTEFAGMWQVGVAANIPLFHWGEKIYTLRAAESEKRAAEYQLNEAREKISLEQTQTEFKLAEATKKLSVAQANSENADENLHFAKLGFEAGEIAPLLLMEAQTAWLKANSEAIDAAIDLKLTRLYWEKARGILGN
ncbi:MAG: TolC family protein [Prevotellaceae bacterium]|jgi:outer membrane protein TolC|nr:TolC family protein [Prevotellaceae bacterium]